MIQEVFIDCDDKRIYGKIYRPDNNVSKLPVVILCHGLYANHKWLEYYAEGLVRKNIVSFLFDFCGAADSLSDGELIDSSPLTEKENLDAVISNISDMDFVDEDNFFLLGHSQGGLVAAYCAKTNDIKGLFLLSPAFNVPDEMKNVPLPLEGEFTKILPGLVGRRYILDSRSIDVEKLFDEYSGSVYIFHGSEDNAVPIESSINASQEYENCVLTVLDDEKHNLSQKGQEKVLDYMIKTIMGVI